MDITENPSPHTMMRGGIFVFTYRKLHMEPASWQREASRCEAFRERERTHSAVFGKRTPRMPAYPDGVIFLPALMPMEAAVLPAQERPERRAYGVLRMVPGAWEAVERRNSQRTKIWVR